MNAKSCVLFCEPAAAMDSFYNNTSQGNTNGSSPCRAFSSTTGSSNKFSPMFLTSKGQSSFGNSGGRSGSSPKFRSCYFQGECVALDASGGPVAPVAALFSKYYPQPQPLPPPLYAQ